MDKVYFLITDIDVLDGSSQLLQRLTAPALNTVVYAIVSDFLTLRNHRTENPSVNWVYVDLKKSVNVNKELLTCLPELDVILNYSGGLLANSLHRVRSLKVAKTVSMAGDEVSVSGIHAILEANDKTGTVVVNVQKRERAGCSGAEALNKLFAKEKSRRSQEELEVDLKFSPGKKFVSPTSAPGTSSQDLANLASHSQSEPGPSQPQPPPNRFSTLAPLLLQETQPLLEGFDSSREQRPVALLPRLMSTLLCCVYPGCWTPPERALPPPPRFSSEPEIRAHTRTEQQATLRRKLRRILDSAEADWWRIMTRIDSDEVLAIEQLALRMNQVSPLRRLLTDSESAESSDNPGSDPQLDRHWELASPDPASSSGSSHDARAAARLSKMELELEKELKAQEEEQKKATEATRDARRRVGFVWDANREYHEQADAIRASMREERRCKEEEFYSMWVGRMLTLLRGVKDKTTIKYDKLYYETFRRQAPFE